MTDIQMDRSTTVEGILEHCHTLVSEMHDLQRQLIEAAGIIDHYAQQLKTLEATTLLSGQVEGGNEKARSASLLLLLEESGDYEMFFGSHCNAEIKKSKIQNDLDLKRRRLRLFELQAQYLIALAGKD